MPDRRRGPRNYNQGHDAGGYDPYDDGNDIYTADGRSIFCRYNPSHPCCEYHGTNTLKWARIMMQPDCQALFNSSW